APIRSPPALDSQAVQKTVQLNRMVQIIDRFSRMGKTIAARIPVQASRTDKTIVRGSRMDKTIAAELLVRDNRTTTPKRVRALLKVIGTCRDRVVQTTVLQITM